MTAAETYLSTLARSTRRVAGGDLRTIASLAFSGPPGDPPWHTLGVEEGSRVREALAGRYAPATANRMLSNLRGVVRALWRSGALSWDVHLRILASLPAVRGGRLGKGRALTWAEVGRLLDAARGAEERALLAVAAGAGLRCAELAGLTWDRYRRAGGATYLAVLGKGNRERRLRLPTWAADRLSDWRCIAPRREHVFRWRNVKSVWRIVSRAAGAAGLGELAPHDLRRTFASLALSSGIGTADLRRMMGHASIGTTVKYDRRPDAAVMEAAEKLDDPEGLTPGRGTGSQGGVGR